MRESPVQPTESFSRRILGLRRLLDGVDPRLARAFIPWTIRHPRHLPAFLRIMRANERAHLLRRQSIESGLPVPPFLVLSVTSRCNLRCAGCFAVAIGTTSDLPAARPPLTLADWQRILAESAALGVVGFVIAGGEPFLLPGIAALFQHFSDRLFLVFTNGTAIGDEDFATLKRCRNTFVVVSVEGDRSLTDARRGPGVYENALRTLGRLRTAGVLTGLSVTIGPENIDFWSQERNIDALISQSGPLAFFIEEIPTGECEPRPAITQAQRTRFREIVVRYRSRETGGAYIIHSPGDEDYFGGCISAGRGFAHVNPFGDVTACPMSALATHNLNASTVSEALASPLFTMIREDGPLLETHDHPCALFANAVQLETMATALGAYRTGTPNPAAPPANPLVNFPLP
jgi:MoaA/NifB/PqqE/SkfB family radical SAM enzyme